MTPGQAALQNRVCLLSQKKEVGHVAFIEGIAGEHLPVAHEQLAHVIADIFKFEQTQMVDRARVDLH